MKSASSQFRVDIVNTESGQNLKQNNHVATEWGLCPSVEISVAPSFMAKRLEKEHNLIPNMRSRIDFGFGYEACNAFPWLS
jgi:hypothetical protein